MHDKISLKEYLIDHLIKDIKRQINQCENEMKKAQEEANYHKGAMESRYDTFKEEAQMLRDGYAKEYQKLLELLPLLYHYKKNYNIKHNKVKVGSLVYVYYNDKKRQFYILSNINYTSIVVNNIKYECINSNTPLAKSLLNKEVGDEIEFRNDLIEILEIV